MTRFRTKPFEIEAVQYKGEINQQEVYEFSEGQTKAGPDSQMQVWDKLHDTWVTFYPGQWIIKGQKGEFYPCDAEIFAAKYEEIPAPVQAKLKAGETVFKGIIFPDEMRKDSNE